jgi:hypothetical protein
MDAVIFAAGLATMYAAHQVADHVFGQTDEDAANKAKPGTIGWNAIVSHVIKYHFCMAAMLAVTVFVLSLPVSFVGVFSCLMFSAVTHAILDRRWPVKWILEKTGSPEFAKMQQPLCGMYLADQGLHWFCLWISALLLTI